MLKVKVSKKDIKESYSNIITIPYCDAQFLLSGKQARYYSTRAEGWACDYYEIDKNTIISTGYAPIDSKLRDYELTRKYDDKARAIYCNYDIEYNKRIKKIDKLLEKYVAELLEKRG